jgi:hypothetical protein
MANRSDVAGVLVIACLIGSLVIGFVALGLITPRALKPGMTASVLDPWAGQKESPVDWPATATVEARAGAAEARAAATSIAASATADAIAYAPIERRCGPEDSRVIVRRAVDEHVVSLALKCPNGWWFSDDGSGPELTVQSVPFNPIPPPGGFAIVRVHFDDRDVTSEALPGERLTPVVVAGVHAERVDSETNGDRYVEIPFVFDNVKYVTYANIDNARNQAESDALMSMVNEVFGSLTFIPQ